ISGILPAASAVGRRRELSAVALLPGECPQHVQEIRSVAGISFTERNHAGLPSRNQRMSAKDSPIPDRLNICLALLVVSLCTTLLWASSRVETWWGLALLALAFGLVMNTGYALCHEAEHDIFHPN